MNGSNPHWRWTPPAPGQGAFHMALDDVLLQACQPEDPPLMRVYSWETYCISLGYHQSPDSINYQACANDHIDVVRRPTGGRAVLHAEELTYSIILPLGGQFPSIHDAYQQINQGLVAGLRHLGIDASQEKRSPDFRGHYQTALSASCFSAAAKHEVTFQGRKMIGSAQRQLGNSLLQHGSLLLGDCHATLPHYLNRISSPEERDRMEMAIRAKTCTVQQALGREVSFNEVAKAIRLGMEETFSMTFEEKPIDSNILKQARERMGEFEISRKSKDKSKKIK